MSTKEIGEYYVEIIEERRGVTENNEGFVEATNNCYAGIGYELELLFGEYKRTGRLIAWAGNNAEGAIDTVDTESLDDYLAGWNDEWPSQFMAEGLLSGSN